jgi:hypothetical protein
VNRNGAPEQVGAPDYFEPIVGWRSWAVVRGRAGFRLRSIAFTDVWPCDEALAARCYEAVTRPHWRVWRRPTQHTPVSFNCSCGIYATVDVDAAAVYLHLYDDLPQRSVCHRALGRVALWGTVVEGELGWRSSYAYPQEIFLPTSGTLHGVRLDEIVEGLSVYGVPVHTFDDVDSVAATAGRDRGSVQSARAR